MPDNLKIKGVNIGGWLMMEGYILAGRNIAESEFKEKFKKIYGERELKDFDNLFRNNFIKEEDFKNIASFGANAVRLPFNYRLIEARPYVYDENGFKILENCLSWAQKYKLGIILDLHAAIGAQNIDWHSDSRGKALLWQKKENQERAYCLWERIAAKFKDSPSLIGYDILNEPMPAQAGKDVTSLKGFYAHMIKTIRAIDRKHFIFLEGDNYAQDIDFLENLIADKICISIHTYQPLSFTFNFRPFLKFPGNIDGQYWDEGAMRSYLEPYFKFSRKNNVKIFVGEFGVNWRGGVWGELSWLGAILKIFEEFGFDYTYWTYKAIANNVFPDGLYQSTVNNEYVRREGPVYGWENYLPRWSKEKGRIINFWDTNNFTPNKKLIAALGRFFRK